MYLMCCLASSENAITEVSMPGGIPFVYKVRLSSFVFKRVLNNIILFVNSHCAYASSITT